MFIIHRTHRLLISIEVSYSYSSKKRFVGILNQLLIKYWTKTGRQGDGESGAATRQIAAPLSLFAIHFATEHEHIEIEFMFWTCWR